MGVIENVYIVIPALKELPIQLGVVTKNNRESHGQYMDNTLSRPKF